MEDYPQFLENIKTLQEQEKIILNNLSGTITNIEQVEFETFKISVEIEKNIYCGIYVEKNKNEELQKGDSILLFVMGLVQKERNIYLYLSNYFQQTGVKKENIIETGKKLKCYDLNPSSLIETITKNEEITYNSDIFIYRQNLNECILIPILEEKNLKIRDKTNKEKLEKFISKNEIKDNSLIFIENYLLKKDYISFNNVTIFNKVKLEYLEDYFKMKFTFDYKINEIFYHKMDSNYKNKFVLLKVIDIKEKYIVGIDIFLNIYKIEKEKNNKTIDNIQDVYTIIFIKNYYKLIIEDSNYILEFNDNTYVFIIENSFCDSILNNISVLNFNFLDFIDNGNNYFSQIRFSETNNNFSFEITKKSECVILFTKFNLIKNYYSFTIKLISQNNKEIRIFQITIYFGLLNTINCLINYVDTEAYGCEYFYYNFNYDLPKFQEININGKNYSFEITDDFNSKSRKRFIILNYIGIENLKNYKDKIEKKNDENKTKGSKNNNNEKISDNRIYNISDFLNDYEVIPKININMSFLFIFFHEKDKNKLLGVYDINEINNFNDLEKTIYIPKEEYKIFSNFFKTMSKKNLDIESKNICLKTLEKYKDDIEIEQSVKNDNFDFSFISYENYITYINICLFYYYNKTSDKDGLIEDFEEKFNSLINSNLCYSDRIRIMRFICNEYLRISEENRVIHLIFLDQLLDDNSYKIAIKYNKQMINELEENSQLFIPFLQLDSYILYNYKNESYSYTLSLEPLILTKKHLLLSYDDFIFTCKEKSGENEMTLAFQCTRNDVTAINEYTLFPTNNNCDSKSLRGKDNAVPISTNLLHERNGHSKKDKKNKRNPTPLSFYKENDIIKIDKKYQKIDKLKGIKKGEAGRLVEYFINYKNENLITELIKNHTLGKIMNNVKLFTSNTFEELAKEIANKKSKKSFSFFGLFTNETFNKNEIPKDTFEIDVDNKKQKTEGEEPPVESLEYYEKYYLFPGKIFVYPYSIPVDYVSADEKEKDISEGRKRYLEKYQDAIIQGRKRHYGED